MYERTKEAAKAKNKPIYLPENETCEIHREPSVRFVKTGIWGCCAHRNAITAFNEAIRKGEPTNRKDAMFRNLDYYYTDVRGPKCGHIGKKNLNGTCKTCSEIAEQNRKQKAAVRRESPRQIAIKEGRMWYTPGTPCAAGHMAPRRVSNGSCQQCEADRRAPRQESARQSAFTAGAMWYLPETPCPAGHMAPRRVNNGSCEQCERDRKSQGPKLQDLCPDLLIGREGARLAGLTVYRNGRPCKHGHTGFRYVKSGACLECIKAAHQPGYPPHHQLRGPRTIMYGKANKLK